MVGGHPFLQSHKTLLEETRSTLPVRTDWFNEEKILVCGSIDLKIDRAREICGVLVQNDLSGEEHLVDTLQLQSLSSGEEFQYLQVMQEAP